MRSVPSRRRLSSTPRASNGATGRDASGSSLIALPNLVATPRSRGGRATPPRASSPTRRSRRCRRCRSSVMPASSAMSTIFRHSARVGVAPGPEHHRSERDLTDLDAAVPRVAVAHLSGALMAPWARRPPGSSSELAVPVVGAVGDASPCTTKRITPRTASAVVELGVQRVGRNDAIAVGDDLLDLVAQARHRARKPGRRGRYSSLPIAAAAQGGGVLVDEVVGDPAGDRVRVGGVERRQISGGDLGRGHESPHTSWALAYTP